MRSVDINELMGKTFTSVEQIDDSIVFTESDGTQYNMHHEQDCCESVYIESITGDLSDLVGSPITLASERVSSDEKPMRNDEDSYTWTFYSFATVKGYVDIRWYGSSNGYYSEAVNIYSNAQ